ncbi:MAG: hypothetical protein ABI421_12305 [Polyangiaceae bacterium]
MIPPKLDDASRSTMSSFSSFSFAAIESARAQVSPVTPPPMMTMRRGVLMSITTLREKTDLRAGV